MDELNLEQSIAQLLDRVPAPVQQFVLNDLGNTANLLMAAHNLHADQAGVLERELLLMLLGQEEPAQFAAELKASGVSEATTQAILKDVNERVFKRLRTQERIEGVAPQTPAVTNEARSWVEVTPPQSSQPLAQTPSYTAPQAQATQQSQVTPPSAPVPAARTMASDVAAFEKQKADISTSQQLPGTPLPVPPPSVHIAPAPIPAPSAPPVARPAPTPQPPPPPRVPGVDPYREPIE